MNYNALAISLIAGLSTSLGGLIVVFDNCKSMDKLGYSMSFVTGVMVYISFVDLLQHSIETIGLIKANIAFFLGVAVCELINFMIPHTSHDFIANKPSPSKYPTRHKKDKEVVDRKKLLRAAILIAVGICIHNVPEGAAVYITCSNNIRMGINFALSIAAHNIPEGITVAMPIYYSTGSKLKSFLYTSLSGLSEPLTAVIVGLLFKKIDHEISSFFLAMVAGIMVCISFKELLPISLKFISAQSALYLNMLGMLFISISTCIIHGH